MQTIYITPADHAQVAALLRERRRTGRTDKTDAFLEAELARAQIVAPADMPPEVVTLHSRVRFVDAETGEQVSYRLVLPAEADVREGRISVLSPVGAALLGYRIGDTFPVTTGPRTRHLTVAEVLRDPEMQQIPA